MLKRALIFAAFVVAMFLLPPLLVGAATADEVSPSPGVAPLVVAFAGLVIAGLVLDVPRTHDSLG